MRHLAFHIIEAREGNIGVGAFPVIFFISIGANPLETSAGCAPISGQRLLAYVTPVGRNRVKPVCMLHLRYSTKVP